MPVFSISRIGTFRSCPRQYKFAYIEKPPVEYEDSVEAFLGSRVHEALEKLYRDKRHEKPLSLEELVESFNQAWKDRWSERVLIVRKDYCQENYRLMGERFLSDYYRRYAPFERGRVVGLETQETVPLDDEGRVHLHVRIDRLVDMGDGLYEVHDYKTSSGLPAQAELDQDIQLAAYSLWVRHRFKDFRRVRLVWHYLAFDKELDSWRTDEELEKLRQELLREISTILGATDFPPQESRLCSWCLYRSLCPLWRRDAELTSLPENEFRGLESVKLVDEYVRFKAAADASRREAEEKLARLEQALIELCREDLEKEKIAVLPGSENKVTVREVEQFKWPARSSEERARLVSVLKESDIWDRVSDLDPHALNRFLVGGSDIPETVRGAVASFRTQEKSFRLSISRKKEKEAE
jgi:putative RecB family exonuclease